MASCGTGGLAPAQHDDFGAGAYAAALVVYIIGGFFLKSVLLNWLVGPLFLLLVLYVVPTLWRRLRGWTEPAE